ncbi:GTP-binding protein [Colwellia sp. D2M02]|uniref:CobW family GTP-binding protein n=1 Tax=Colwellia sp. D2M02 TaxID=2841562 RepID=UPI001C0A20D3|nr:GTP-binding protein [Colwellia sp. D2M02]MBU2893186.1 GTP-binding protein [Colwellia sp. D2M02]
MFKNLTPKISAIPTNLITGFLGVGKTTAIVQLLANKPEHENWAVLVNEFGEVGIDAELLTNNSDKNNKANNEKNGVFIRQVPGGCMCCASGVPMQVALNQLIAKAKPDRLLIEPTGLGHPKEVVEVLTSGKYKDLISLQSILCLIDARNLSDVRYTSHPSFVQQLNIADIIIGTKSELYSEQDRENLTSFIALSKLNDKPLNLICHGQIALGDLQKVTVKDAAGGKHQQYLLNNTKRAFSPLSNVTIGVNINEESYIDKTTDVSTDTEKKIQQQIKLHGFIELTNQGEGFFSKGWIFSNAVTFNYEPLMILVNAFSISRIKGIVITEQGSYALNKVGTDISYQQVDDLTESRIELLDTNEQLLQKIKTVQWLDCTLNHHAPPDKVLNN